MSLALAGGAFTLTGNRAAATAASAAAVSLAAGHSSITTTPGAGGPLTFVAGSRSRAPGATVNFAGTGLGGTNNRVTFTTAPTATDGILPYATVGAADFGTYDNGTNVGIGAPQAAGFYKLTLTGATATDNVKLAAGATVPANLTVNPLILDGNSLTLGGGTLTLGSGALRVNGTGATVSAALAQGAVEAIVVPGGDVALSGAVTGTRGLTAAGTGTVALGNPSYTGGTTVGGATLSLGTVPVAAIGGLGALALVGGTLAANPVGTRAVNGLTGDYFNTPAVINLTTQFDFSGLPSATRVDPTVNFVWNSTTPPPAGVGTANGANFDRFAVRWTGKRNVTAAGVTQFQTGSDDGTRLYIDGVQVLNNEGGHGVQNTVGTINPTAGMHDIVLYVIQGNAGRRSTCSGSRPGRRRSAPSPRPTCSPPTRR